MIKYDDEYFAILKLDEKDFHLLWDLFEITREDNQYFDEFLETFKINRNHFEGFMKVMQQGINRQTNKETIKVDSQYISKD